MGTVEDFNPDHFGRRDYQSGHDPTFTRRYWMRTPMFLQVNKGEPKPKPAGHLHKWVLEAARRSPAYYANPARPAVLALEDGLLRGIKKATPSELCRGDIVVVTFTISYLVAGSVWYPQFLPLEIVRVGEVPTGDGTDSARYAVPVVDPSLRPLLSDGEVLHGELPSPSCTSHTHPAALQVHDVRLVAVAPLRQIGVCTQWEPALRMRRVVRMVLV